MHSHSMPSPRIPACCVARNGSGDQDGDAGGELALSLSQTDTAKNETWIAIALYVQRSIDMWRRSFRAYDRHGETVAMGGGATIVRTRPSDPWEIAQRNFPHVDDDTGMLATPILHECGGSVLNRARKPWDHVIALAVLRFAARLLRGERAPVPGIHVGSRHRGHLTVQAYAEETGLSPMTVGYSGPGRPALQALELLRDAHTLRDAVRDAAGGGEFAQRSGSERSTSMPLAWWHWTTECCCSCRWKRRSRSPLRPYRRAEWRSGSLCRWSCRCCR